ncbi:hypothetical protein D3C78_1755610 [compost metagenome]
MLELGIENDSSLVLDWLVDLRFVKALRLGDQHVFRVEPSVAQALKNLVSSEVKA